MSDYKLQYLLGKARYANADSLSANIKINLPLSWRLLPESEVTELVSLVTRYDRERQASSTHRIYGRLTFITTNELTDYNPSTLTLTEPTNPVTNYNLQLTYPSSHTSDITLSDFSCDVFPLLCSYYDTPAMCESHKIYQGLPFCYSQQIGYNGRTVTAFSTFNHKNGNNIKPDDFVYVIPGKGGTLNPMYGIFKVNNVALNDGTFNVVVLDVNIPGDFGGSYKKIIEPSDDDIKFINTISCNVYATGNTINDNELFIRCSEPHNVILGDYIDLRQSGTTTFSEFNGVHKVSRIIDDVIFVCGIPSHMLANIAPVSTIANMMDAVYQYQYRVLDGLPIEYYVRKFEVLTAGDNTTTINEIDYYLQQIYLSQTIWKDYVPSPIFVCDAEKQSGSADDRIANFVFNSDIDISKYTDNLGRPLTELYLGVIKRKNVTEFNCLTTNFQGALMYSGITTFNKQLVLPTYIDPLSKMPLDYFSLPEFNDAGFNIGGAYYGDLCEWDFSTLTETILDPLQFRIGKIINGVDVEGYVYEPFKQIRLRYFSNDIEELNFDYDDIPNYAITFNDSYRWKPISPYGFKEIVEHGIQYVNDPFVNGAHYTFNESLYFLRRQNKNPDSKIILYAAAC